MLEKLKYMNHLGEVIEFGSGSFYVNENDLHNFSWKVTSKNDRISSFKKSIVNKSLPVIIVCSSKEEGIRKRNQLFEICEKDVLAMQHGRLIIGDYYLKCYVVESKKTDYLTSAGYMKLTLKVSTDFPEWVKETTTAFGYAVGKEKGSDLDFNRDFPSDYTSNLLGIGLINTGFVPSNFIIRIYGACDNPKITIAGHEYSVNGSCSANEYMTIDSIAKTITNTKADGSIENCFNLRNRDSYIFEKIPVGISNVSSNGDFKFDVTLLEERSEPRWT